MADTTQGSTAAGRPLMDTKAAADFLGLTPRALEKRRSDGRGPPFVRISSRAVRYRPEDLNDWLTARTENATAAD